jgi:ribosome biogenesis GTPase
MMLSPDRLDRLRPIGFNSLVANRVAALPELDGAPARVCEHSHDHALIHDGAAAQFARVHPALARQLSDSGARLVVGDWVIASQRSGDWWMDHRLDPYTELQRVDPSGAPQALVSNIDCAFLVMGLDGDFNLRRLERYLALARSGGVVPVVVLTKADLCLELDRRLDDVRDRLPSSIDRHALDARSPGDVSALTVYLQPGQTVVLLGSSGAGKSTLTNTLLGTQQQATAPVRADDSRGRHTTTTRTLLQLPGSACLIDTPGLRGLRLDIDPAALQELFEDIAQLAKHCRFRDCAHETEPGCAVREGVPADRLSNYHKLRREITRENADALARRAEKGHAKAMERAIRGHYRLKPGKR